MDNGKTALTFTMLVSIVLIIISIFFKKVIDGLSERLAQNTEDVVRLSLTNRRSSHHVKRKNNIAKEAAKSKKGKGKALKDNTSEDETSSDDSGGDNDVYVRNKSGGRKPPSLLPYGEVRGSKESSPDRFPPDDQRGEAFIDGEGSSSDDDLINPFV
jgi:hypothetical protein